ncbi:hypothetical protein BDV12DRAFT_201384 [Aspergillus spectabilis]
MNPTQPPPETVVAAEAAIPTETIIPADTVPADAVVVPAEAVVHPSMLHKLKTRFVVIKRQWGPLMAAKQDWQDEYNFSSGRYAGQRPEERVTVVATKTTAADGTTGVTAATSTTTTSGAPAAATR